MHAPVYPIVFALVSVVVMPLKCRFWYHLPKFLYSF